MLTKEELMAQLAPTAIQPIGEGYCVKSGPAADALIELETTINYQCREIEELWKHLRHGIGNIEELQSQNNTLIGEVNNLIDRIKVLENAPSEEESEPAVTPAPRLTPVRWAQLLIEQLPSDHDGRNSWLMNHGTGGHATLLREQWSKKHGRPWTTEEA